MNPTQIILLCICGVFFLIIALIVAIGDRYSLNGIPNKPIGNGQHGTARFATKGEVAKTYKQIPYTPHLWRKGEQLPTVDGLIVGCHENAGQMTALVDDADIHTLMIGASGVGKLQIFCTQILNTAVRRECLSPQPTAKAISIEIRQPLQKNIMATRFQLKTYIIPSSSNSISFSVI